MSEVVNGVEEQLDEPKVHNSEPPAPPKLTESEMLRLENLALKVQNIVLQEQRLQNDLVKANGMRHEYQKTLDSLRKEISSRVGVDVGANTTKILPDGTIIDTRGMVPAQPGN